MYEIRFSKAAVKKIDDLTKNQKSKLKEIIGEMKLNPFSVPFTRIKGEINVYRIRIGDYRILFEMDKEERIISILKVEHRKKIYSR